MSRHPPCVALNFSPSATIDITAQVSRHSDGYLCFASVLSATRTGRTRRTPHIQPHKHSQDGLLGPRTPVARRQVRELPGRVHPVHARRDVPATLRVVEPGGFRRHYYPAGFHYSAVLLRLHDGLLRSRLGGCVGG